jgi:serine/threonine-protein phosphatase PGAM5
MATRTIYLVRHGEYDWDNQPSPQKGLTERVVEQAKLTAQRLSSVPATGIYSSDLRRAVETAETIHGRLDGVAHQKTENLREVIPGIPSYLANEPLFMRIPEEAAHAGREAAELVFSEYFIPAEETDRHEIIVSHGNLIRYLASRVMDGSGDGWMRMRTNNCGISEVAVESDGRMWLVSYNDVGHLPPELTTAGVPRGAHSAPPAK